MKKSVPPLVMFSLCLSFFTHASSLAQDTYLSKSYIDSLVQSAYYRFNEAEQFKCNHTSQQDAVCYARKISAYLRRTADQDLNQRYILWKVNELEQHIALEEQDIHLKTSYQRQLTLNNLIDQFNIEVGHDRPDFTILNEIYSRMVAADKKKAREIYWLIEDRSMNISNEVSFYLHTSITDKDHEMASREFCYLQSNRQHLRINDSLFTHFQSVIDEGFKVNRLVMTMPGRINKANFLIQEMNIGEAWKVLKSLRRNLKTIYPYTQPDYFQSLKYAVKDSWRRIVHVEDSLVRTNFTLIKAKDSKAASAYLDFVLRKHGVSKRKVMLVEKVVMGMPVEESKKVRQYVKKEMTPLLEKREPAKVALSYESMQKRVKQRLKNKRQSPKVIEKPELNKDALATNKAKARFFTRKLYDCLENNEIVKAFERFQKIRKPLKKYSPKHTFATLEDAINNNYQAFIAQKKFTLLTSTP